MIRGWFGLSAAILFAACENKEQGPTATTTGNHAASGGAEAAELGEGIVNARGFSMAEFSDFFDYDVTMSQVRERFGPEGMKEIDGDFVELWYELDSDKLFAPGVRMQIMKVIFKGEQLVDVQLSFATLSER